MPRGRNAIQSEPAFGDRRVQVGNDSIAARFAVRDPMLFARQVSCVLPCRIAGCPLSTSVTRQLAYVWACNEATTASSASRNRLPRVR